MHQSVQPPWRLALFYNQLRKLKTAGWNGHGSWECVFNDQLCIWLMGSGIEGLLVPVQHACASGVPHPASSAQFPASYPRIYPYFTNILTKGLKSSAGE